MTAALLASAGPAAAHGGDTTKVHACIVTSSGYAQIIGANESCTKNYRPQDWPALDTNTTYSAGSGLSLSSNNVFSVTGAPWGGLTGVPAGFLDGKDDVGDTWDGLSGVPPGFADGVDDVGNSVDMKTDDPSAPKEPNDGDGFVHWNNLEGVPGDIFNGDDDGTGKVNQLKADLAGDDSLPDQPGDLVSFTKVKHLTGRITGAFVQDGSIAGEDIRNDSIQGEDIRAGTVTGNNLAQQAVTGSNLAGSYAFGAEVVPGAVTSDKVRDGAIETRDLASQVVNRFVSMEDLIKDLADPTKAAPQVASNHIRGPDPLTVGVNPGAAAGQERVSVTVDAPVTTNDIVTVSPPENIEDSLVLAGSDVLSDGKLTIYLYNASTVEVDGEARAWKVRRLKMAR